MAVNVIAEAEGREEPGRLTFEHFISRFATEEEAYFSLSSQKRQVVA